MTRVLGIFILLFALTAVTGCGHGKLREDPVIPAVKANYPTLEFWACGELHHGLGTCYLPEGEPHDSVKLKVQGYYKGTMRIYSAACGLDLTMTYKDSQLIPVQLPALEPGRNCLVTVVMSPEYPRESRQEVAIYSLKGILAIRIKKGSEIWTGATRKVTGNWRSQLDVMVGNYASTPVAIRGCGKRYDQNLPVDKGVVHIPLHEAVQHVETGDCVAEGVALVGTPDATFSVLIAQYATTLPNDLEWRDYGFIPLAIPIVEMSGGRLKVEAVDYVSIISLNDEFKMDFKASFSSFDRSKFNVLRLITVKGRTVLGVWEPGAQEWEWRQ